MDDLLDFFKAYDISLSQLLIVAIIFFVTIAVELSIRLFFRRYEKATQHSHTINILFYLSFKKGRFLPAFFWSNKYGLTN